MAKNIKRDEGAVVYTTKNGASAKVSGQLVPWPLTQAAGNPVALLREDAAANQDGVTCYLADVVFEYTCVAADTGDPGAQLYFDAGNDRLTTTASTHNKAGRLAESKLNGPTTALCHLNAP